MDAPRDLADELCDAVRRAFEAGETLRIAGAGSKGFLTRGGVNQGTPASRLLSVAEHRGILDYRPEELVLTARAGTPLKEIERTLARSGQHLPFEPPRFHGGGTLGGAVACGLSGPGRPWRGAVRDALLGVELANGRGERLRFGGQVMKNVAGYDVSRLQAGAFGTLGLLLALSVKVLPRPDVERTLVFDLDATTALDRCRRWAREPYPITATCYLGGCLRVRLSGAEPAVAWAAAELGGEVRDDASFWEALRDHGLEFFSAVGALWRCAVPAAAPLPLQGCLVSWAGAERWWRPDCDGAAAAAQVAAQGGAARPFDGAYGLRTGPHLSLAEGRYAARLREAFDPGGVLNAELSSAPEAIGAD